MVIRHTVTKKFQLLNFNLYLCSTHAVEILINNNKGNNDLKAILLVEQFPA